MADIDVEFCLGHIGTFQDFLRLHESRDGGVVVDAVVFEECHPLFQSVGNRRAEGIDAYQAIFGENVTNSLFF